MKKQFIFLYIFIFLLAAGVLLEHIPRKDRLSEIETKRFQTQLLKKRSQTVDLMNQIADSLERRSLSQNELFNTFADLFDLDDRAFVVYENNDLVFWTNNALPVANLDPENSNEILKLGNSWYWKYDIKQNSYRIFGFVLIKKVFSYENRFVNSHFHEDFNLSDNIVVVPDSSRGAQVRDNNGNFLFSLVKKEVSEEEQTVKHLPGVCYLLSILFLLMFLYRWLNVTFNSRLFLLRAFIAFAGIIILRYVMIIYEIPRALYQLKFFDPTYYASSSMIPSLGDLILHLVFAGIFLYPLSRFFRQVTNACSLPLIGRWGASGVFMGLNVVFFVVMNNILQSIVYNSSFSLTLYNLLDFTVYSLLGFLAIFLLIFIYFMVADLSLFRIKQIFGEQRKIWSTSFFIIASSVLLYFIIPDAGIVTPGFFLLSNGFILYVLWKGQHYRYIQLVLFVVLTSLFVTYFVDYHSNVKENQKRKILVSNLENERDRVGEYLLRRIEPKITEDSVLVSYIENDKASREQLSTYLSSRYFDGYFRKYNVQTALCYPEEDIIQIYDISMSDYAKCKRFRKLIEDRGVAMNGSRFFFLDNPDNRISYMGAFQFQREDSKTHMLYVLLESKPSKTLLGYPDLLLDEEITQESPLSNYSYAKYKNGELLRHSGDYAYPVELIDYFQTSRKYTFCNYEEYHHLVYQPEEHITILISKPRIHILDILAQFSYVFAIYYLLILLLFLVKDYPENFRKFNYNFKNKIKLSMILLLIVSLLAVGTATVYYTIDQFRSKQKETISEKLQSIIVELESQVVSESPLDEDYSNYLNSLLTKYSNTFYVDMNLYSLDGELIASSRPQIFERNLLGKKMNPRAYQNLAYYDQPRFIHNEKIGDLEYHSAYVPLYNQENERMAYLNLPYFTRQKALKKEIYAIVMVLVNIYVFLIILGTVTAVIVSNNITKPLRLIQDRLRQIGLNKQNEKIAYESHDEVGELISEYNRMVEELDNKARQLAQTEREFAWREMAKQIAHEIKNPLTPMKLKVQYLKRAWDDNVADFGERLQQFTTSMINQINTLSGIATEFSSFAKMPKAKNQHLDMNQEVREAIALYEQTKGVHIQFYPEEEHCPIFVDKDQIARVFSNLIKNAIQAIPGERKGEIRIYTGCDDAYVYISVRDNGKGISQEIRDKLFNPNFTTKSGGMGMGLAISKRIIEDFEGTLWYETVYNQGTTFHIKLPRHKE